VVQRAARRGELRSTAEEKEDRSGMIRSKRGWEAQQEENLVHGHILTLQVH